MPRFCVIVFLFLFMASSSSYAGSFRKDDQNWDIKVYKTTVKRLADIIVYEVPDFPSSYHQDAFWKWNPSGNTAVTFTDSIDDAQLVIYITKNKKEAGWKRRHPLIGHFQE